MNVFLNRNAERFAKQILSDTPVLGLVGPRQAGKSTFAKHLSGPQRAYLTLDDPNQLAAARFDPVGFVRNLTDATIDEIQRAPDLMLAIKQSVDADRRPGRFIVTGSANILTARAMQDSMAGRIETLKLFPFSQDELRSNGPAHFLDDLFTGEVLSGDIYAAIRGNSQFLEQIVLQGGYAEVLARPETRRRRDWLNAYITAITEKDLPDIASIDRSADMPRFMQLLALVNSQLINYSDIGARLGIDRKTAARYLQVLEQLFIVQVLPAWAHRQINRLVKSPKLHFVDTALAAHLQGVTATSLAKDRMPLGNLLASFVFSELSKQATWAEGRYRFYHYRDNAGSEVDFIIEDDQQRQVGVEVKAAASVKASDFSGLRKFQAASTNFQLGVVLYDGNVRLSFGPNMLALPIASIWSTKVALEATR